MTVVQAMDTVLNRRSSPLAAAGTQEQYMKEAPDSGSFDAVIIGGGPAGITCGIYLMRKMINTLMITPELGGQVSWTADVENYPGYLEISGIDLAEMYKRQLGQFPINLRLGDSVTELEMSDNGGVVRTQMGGEYRFKSAVIASGKRSKKLGVPGEEEFYGRGVTFCATCDGPLYRGETVAVVGGGNSGVGAANELAGIGCEVHLINNMANLQADRIIADRATSNDAITIHADTEITAITGDRSVSGVTIRNAGGTERSLAVSGVFVEIGLEPNSRFAEPVVATNAHHEIIVDCRCATDVPGIFAAGDVTSVPNKQIVIAAGEGAKAALGVADYLMKQP